MRMDGRLIVMGKVDYINADYGFIALDLSIGTHDITLKYSLPNWKFGMLLSLVGAAGMIVELIYLKIRLKNKIKK